MKSFWSNEGDMSDSYQLKISMKGCNMLNYLLLFRAFFGDDNICLLWFFDMHGLFGNLGIFTMPRAVEINKLPI